jgi:3-deoxy-7-phosphoheptulonate synthase
MIRAYANSAAAMNMLRAYLAGGLADLHGLHDWNKDFVRASPAGERYEAIAREIDRALDFIRACGMTDSEAPADGQPVLLARGAGAGVRPGADPGERLAGVRSQSVISSGWASGPAARHAHIDFISRLANPIGVKLGPAPPGDGDRAVREAQPRQRPGRLTLISRMGNGKVRDALPRSWRR